MGPYEVRIHYAANNTVSEDTRWMRIAQGTINFRPARRIHLSNSIIDVSESEEFRAEDTSQPQNSTQLIIISSQPEASSQSQPSVLKAVKPTSKPTSRRVSKRKAEIPPGEESPDAAKRTKRTSFARAKQGLNPAFKNPIATYMRTRKSSSSIWKTPESQYSPGKVVVVPVTESPKRRRTSPSLDRIENGVEEIGSPEQRAISCVDETSCMENSMNPSESVGTRPLAVSQSITNDHSFEINKYPGNQEQLHVSDDHVPQSILRDQNVSLTTFHEGFGETELDMGTWTGLSAHENTVETIIATTATPSDQERYLDNSSPLARKSAANKSPSLVDLTSSPDGGPPQVTRRDVLGPVSSPVPIPMREEPSGPHGITPVARHRNIMNLPKRVMCHATHRAESRPFKSLIPQYLSDLAERFGLVNHFRPVLAPVSIRNGERGYWILRIQISDMVTVVRSRRCPLTSSQWSDKRFMLRQEGSLPEVVSTAEGDNALRQLVYPHLDPEAYTPWTADEFEIFWAYLQKVVEEGRAGYDVRATMKCSEQASEDLYVDVKLYGYAEILSHIWLVLYGVSSSLTAAMPLQWCMPGTGPLITMSGQPKRGGALGRWLPKECGVDGSWGLEEEEEEEEEDWDENSPASNLEEPTNNNRSG